MKTRQIALTFAGLLTVATAARANIAYFNLSNPLAPGGQVPAGSQPYLRAEIDDSIGDANTVQLKLEALNMVGSEKITEWFFNLEPQQKRTGLTWSVVSNNTGLNPLTDIAVKGSQNTSTFKADGDGYFDLAFSFPTSGNVFSPGELLVINLTSTTLLSAGDFGYSSEPGGGNGTWYSAAHVQSIAGGASAWIGAGAVDYTLVAIPEPSTYAALMGGVTLLGVVLVRRRTVSV